MITPKPALALVHYPVIDRRREIVTTSVTNLDLHDLARTACTYHVDRVYVVTPVIEQQRLAERIMGHWREGFGADYNPSRGRALQCLEVASSLDEALDRRRHAVAATVRPVLTAAGCRSGLSFDQARRMMQEESLFLVFGTGWGLAPELFDRGWPVLEAVRGPGETNHLPVRAAAAIILDRLLGARV